MFGERVEWHGRRHTLVQPGTLVGRPGTGSGTAEETSLHSHDRALPGCDAGSASVEGVAGGLAGFTATLNSPNSLKQLRNRYPSCFMFGTTHRPVPGAHRGPARWTLRMRSFRTTSLNLRFLAISLDRKGKHPVSRQAQLPPALSRRPRRLPSSGSGTGARSLPPTTRLVAGVRKTRDGAEPTPAPRL